MVDRVYKSSLPKFNNDLKELRKEFSDLGSNTDWVRLRINPLLKHLNSLEDLLEQKQYSKEFARLTKGVALFHSDLVYFRTNIKELEKLLKSEKRSIHRS